MMINSDAKVAYKLSLSYYPKYGLVDYASVAPSRPKLRKLDSSQNEFEFSDRIRDIIDKIKKVNTMKPKSSNMADVELSTLGIEKARFKSKVPMGSMKYLN